MDTFISYYKQCFIKYYFTFICFQLYLYNKFLTIKAVCGMCILVVIAIVKQIKSDFSQLGSLKYYQCWKKNKCVGLR